MSKTLEEVIYQCRWVDGIKNDPSMVSDKSLAKAIEEAGWTRDPLEANIRKRLEILKKRREDLWEAIKHAAANDMRIRESMIREEYEKSGVEVRLLESLLP